MSVPLYWTSGVEDLAGYHRATVAGPRGRYGFWLLGALLVSLLLWLIRPQLTPQHPQAGVSLTLRVSADPQPAVPDAIPPAEVIPVPVIAEPQADVSSLATSESEPVPAEPTSAEPPVVNLRASGAALLQDYQASLPEAALTTATGATVMDPLLRSRLAATAAAKPAPEPEAAALPDSFGDTRVEIGEHCFMTSTLDDQAMRGMKNWWVGLCGTPKPAAISLKGVKLPGAD